MPSRRELLAALGGVGAVGVGVTAADDPTTGGDAATQTTDGDAATRTASPLRWERTYTPGDVDYGLVRGLVATDSGVIAVGVVGDLTAYRGWVGSVGDDGRPGWSRQFGEPSTGFRDAVAVGDGVVAVGVTNRTNRPGVETHTDPFVVRLDGAGEHRWSRTYRPTAVGGAADAVARAGERVVVCGSTLARDPDAGDATAAGAETAVVTRPWVAGLDGDGVRQWDWVRDGAASDDGRGGSATDLAVVTDSGGEGGDADSGGGDDGTGGGDGGGGAESGDAVVVCGSTHPAGEDAPHGAAEAAWVARLSRDRGLAWQWVQGGDAGGDGTGEGGAGGDGTGEGDAGGSRVEGVAPGPDGGVVCVGRRGFTAGDDGVAWLFALDADGRRRWERTLPRPHWDWHHGIRRVGSEYVLCGTRGTTGDADDRVAWLTRVGPDGTVREQFDGPRGTRGYAVAPAAGGVVVGGDSERENGRHPPWLARVGGEPVPPGGPFEEVTPPTLPGWVLPFAAGGVAGAVGLSLLGGRRDRR